MTDKRFKLPVMYSVDLKEILNVAGLTFDENGNIDKIQTRRPDGIWTRDHHPKYIIIDPTCDDCVNYTTSYDEPHKICDICMRPKDGERICDKFEVKKNNPT